MLSSEPSSVPSASVWKALLSGYTWSGGSVTYGFASGAADYYANPMYSGYSEPSQFLALSAAGKGIVRAAFSTWSGIVNLTITEAASGVHPDLNVGGSSIPDTAWAYYPGANDSSGDVWFGLDKSFFSKLVSSSGPYIGSYEYATALHEIGHALGLKHPHQGTVKLDPAYDGLEYSVMSYRSYLGGPTSYYTVETWGFPQSLMMLDIAAIQDIYGADFTTQSGNTVYGFDPLTGEMTVNGASAGVPGANRVFRTIWDGGGTDTIDLSAYSTNLDIDLNPGKGIDLDVGGTLQRAQLSSTVYAAHHIYMSLLYNGDTRSLIENATGGSGDDILRGNLAANLLKGGAGADTLTGGLGIDTLTLGSGKDTVTDTIAGLNGDKVTDFNIQDDRIVVQGVKLSAAQVSFSAAKGQLLIDLATDGSPDAILDLSGNLAGSRLTPVLVTSAAGTEIRLQSGTTSSTTSSSGSAGTTTKPAGTTSLTTGNDTYLNAAGTNQSVDGLAGNDTITTGGGRDKLWGGTGADHLDGGAGNDQLFGDAGGDILNGGAGIRDRLTGGAGPDTFVFEAADFTAGIRSSKIVTDYVIGQDTLEFHGFQAATLTDLAPRDTAQGLRLTVDASNYVYLQGVTLAQAVHDADTWLMA